MNSIDEELLRTITGTFSYNGAYSIRKNGVGIESHNTDNVKIENKKDKPGLNIYIKGSAHDEVIDIPVILTDTDIKEVVYNDFYIESGASVTIVAGCGIHSEVDADSEHDGIHKFFISENANVKYVEKHYAEGEGRGKKILSPVTEIYLGKNSTLEMETSQIKGVDDAVRTTKAELSENAKLIINEKIMTHNHQKAKTKFDVVLNGEKASCKVTSRSVAIDSSRQQFISKVTGNYECFGHVECDALIKDKAIVSSDPKIVANTSTAELIHEATIGKIANDQLIKLMTLGHSKEEAEEIIIQGFLK